MNRSRLAIFVSIVLLAALLRPMSVSAEEAPPVLVAQKNMTDKLVDYYLSMESKMRGVKMKGSKSLDEKILAPIRAVGESLIEIKTKIDRTSVQIGEAAESIQRFTGTIGKIFRTIEEVLGFRVMGVLTLTIILMMGINISGIADGRTSFIAALIAVSGLWYLWNKSWNPAGGGDVVTIAKTFGWIMTPYLAIFALKILFSSLYGVARREWSIRSFEAARTHAETALPLLAGPQGLFERRDLYDFEELAGSLSRLCHKAWATEEEDERDGLADEAAMLRADLARLLLKAPKTPPETPSPEDPDEELREETSAKDTEEAAGLKADIPKVVEKRESIKEEPETGAE